MMQENRRRIKFIVISFLLIILGMLIYQVYQNSHFRLAKITPNSSGTVPTSLNRFQLEFNKDLDQNVDYTKQLDDPGHQVTNFKLSGRSMTIITKPHQDSRKYSFKLKNISAKNGAKINEISFHYTAKYISYNKLSADEKKLLDEQANAPKTADPIIGHLPHGTLDYNLTAVFGEAEGGESNSFVLNAELLLSNSDIRLGEEAAIAAYKKEVTDYILSLGLKPENYTIQYKITRQ